MSLEPILESTVLVQIECRSADCSTAQDQRRRLPGCQDEVWCEGRRGLHELQSGERLEWKLMRLVHISSVCNLVPYHSINCYQLISEHFGNYHVTLLLTAAK